jgi:hypothetical protein
VRLLTWTQVASGSTGQAVWEVPVARVIDGMEVLDTIARVGDMVGWLLFWLLFVAFWLLFCLR